MNPYEKLSVGSDKLKAVLGLPATIVRKTGGTKNEITGKLSGATTARIPVTAAKRSKEIENKETGLKTAVTVFTVWSETRIGDVIEFADQTYIVEAVKVSDPDGTALMWKAIVRTGA